MSKVIACRCDSCNALTEIKNAYSVHRQESLFDRRGLFSIISGGVAAAYDCHICLNCFENKISRPFELHVQQFSNLINNRDETRNIFIQNVLYDTFKASLMAKK